MRNIGLIFCLLLFIETLVYSQKFNVFIEESGPHAEFVDSVWGVLFDSLRSWGARLTISTQPNNWNPSELDSYDVIWLIGSDLVPHPYNDSQKIFLQNRIKDCRKVILWIYGSTLSPEDRFINILLDTNWETTVSISYYTSGVAPNYIASRIIFKFSFSEGIDSLMLYNPMVVNCGNNCYPFILFEYNGIPYPAGVISYPYVNQNNCGYLLIMEGTDTWETYAYFPPVNPDLSEWRMFRLPKNFLLNSISEPDCRFPCSVPEPYQISVTSIPPCANPGDTVRICGRNLWRGKTESLGGDIEIYIGATEPVPHEYDTIVIPIRYSQDYTGDSTWLEFIMPDLPPGTYPIRLGHKAITFDAGDIIVPCPMVTEIPECANPGDTVIVSGVNLLPDIVIQIDDTIIEPINYALGYDTLEFVCPSLPAGAHDISFFWDTLEIFSGSILIPCPPTIEIPECANPGDTVVVSGVNLFPDIVIQIGDLIIEPISYALGYDTLEFICPSIPSGAHQISFFWDTLEIFSGSILIPCPTASASFPECADPGDVVTISGENLIEPIRIVVGDSVVSAVSYSEDRSRVSFRCPWLPRGRYQVNLSWHDMFVASGTIEIPCPHRCERFPNPITPNFDAINDLRSSSSMGYLSNPPEFTFLIFTDTRYRR